MSTKKKKAAKKKATKIEREPKKKIIKEVVLRPNVEVEDERLLLPRHLTAKAFGVTMDMVGKWSIKPVIKKGREALFYLPEVVQFRIGNEDGQKLDPSQEKAKLDVVRREKAEIELRKQKGELVEISEVCRELEKELVGVRQKLLAIPNKLARPIVVAENPQEAQDMIYRAIENALKDLNYGERIDFKGSESNSEDSETASETKSS